jgi:hypothetical protein
MSAPVLLKMLDACIAWHGDLPPCDATGDAAIDKKLADMFRRLLVLPDARSRESLIEDETVEATLMPRPGAAPDLYRKTLISWWLAIYEAERRAA